MTDVVEVIKNVNGKWFLYTSDGKKKLGGPYKSRAQALKRERQVQFFKHRGEKMARKRKPEFILQSEDALKEERKHHSDAWHRCWEKVKGSYDERSAAAICTWSVGRSPNPPDVYEANATSVAEVKVKMTVKDAQSIDPELAAVMKDKGIKTITIDTDTWDLTEEEGTAEVMAELDAFDNATPAMSTMPFDAYSFDALFNARQAQETVENAAETLKEFLDIARNILYAPVEKIPDKAQALRGLIEELIAVLPEMAAASGALAANAENPTMAEAATIKNKVRALIKALDEVLTDKEIPDGLRTSVKDMREIFKTKAWADLATDAQTGSQRQSESETQTATTQHNEPGGPGGGIESLCESYAGSVDMLSEAEKGEALAINIRPIRVGAGNQRDGHYYDSEMLRANASKLVGAKMYETDHKANEKSTRTWVSTITELKGFETDGSPIMKVAIHDPNFAQRVQNLAAAKDGDGNSLLSKLECSLLASGVAKSGMREGKQYKVVENITDIQSVDWVTRAGAGGGALSIAETASTSIPTQEGVNMTNQTSLVEVTTTTITPVIETTTPIAETVTTAPAAKPEGTVITIEAEPTYLESTAIQEVLGKSNLPQVAKDKLAKGRYQKIEEVEAAVKEESDYVKELRGSGRPFAQGNSNPQAPQTQADYDTRISEIIKQYTSK